LPSVHFSSRLTDRFPCSFRLIAVSLLPLSKESLIYGSADAGRTVKKSNLEFNEKMAMAAQQLNLKRHMVGPTGREVPIDSCCDIEGHLGADGRY
jgi:Clustered mitochondria